MRHVIAGIVLVLALSAFVSAENFRQAVIVQRPDGMPRRAAEMAMDSLAKKALIEKLIATKMSPILLSERGEDIRVALEPVNALLNNFIVLNREEIDASNTKVTCEAEVDLAAVLLRMVSSKVLSFDEDPPRILLLPTANTAPSAMQAIRGRLGDSLGSAGFKLLAAEATATAWTMKAKVSQTEIAAMTRQVAETRADLIALVDLIGSNAPSPVGGVVLDAVLQYTVVRPRDNAIIAEQVFTTRGSGATRLLAEQSVLADLGPQMGQSLAGKLTEAIFADGEVIDGSGALSNSITLNIFFRPSSAATSALMDLLRAKGTTVNLGTSSMAGIEAEIRNRVGDVGFAEKKLTPSDRLVVSGKISVEELFNIFAKEKFGPSQALNVSVIEYGDNYLGVEIVNQSGQKVITKASLPPPNPNSASIPRQAGWKPTFKSPLIFKKKHA